MNRAERERRYYAGEARPREYAFAEYQARPTHANRAELDRAIATLPKGPSLWTIAFAVFVLPFIVLVLFIKLDQIHQHYVVHPEPTYVPSDPSGGGPGGLLVPD